MTDQEPAGSHDSNSESRNADTTEKAGSSNAAGGTMANDNNQHVVCIVGTYSLFTFFKKEAQSRFFKIITSPEYEETFKPRSAYRTDGRSATSFRLDRKEKEFELRMTNMGLIREGFWQEAFPPIFQLTDKYVGSLPGCTNFELNRATQAPESETYAEAVFYRLCLSLLDQELVKVGGQREIHIGLNRFGIVNIGITIKWPPPGDQRFEDLCKEAYTKISHLQEDPLEDLKGKTKKMSAGDQKQLQEQVSKALDTGDCPRLVVSYFQVLAITTIHRFLHDKLVDKTIGGFKKEWLANPWELSNKIPESTRHGLPPLRHVVFMYQLVHSFSEKATFLGKNRRALLTLGHNVGWSPSWNPPFPLFDSRRAKLPDSSLLETSCCLVFPQGLVVVIPPDPDPANEKFQTMYLGGNSDNCSSVTVTYRDYWKLIFKLFIRVTEARLLIGMVTRELADIHKAFLKNRQAKWGRYLGTLWIDWLLHFVGKLSRYDLIHCISRIHSQLMVVGSIIQRTSGRVITPEVTRYSFVRRKLTDFLKTVNFKEHRGSIQSEFEKLNEWVIAVRTTWVARAAIVVAIAAAILTLDVGGGISWVQKRLNPDGANSACANQTLSESVKGLSGEIDKLKQSTADEKSEMDSLKTSTTGLNSELGNLQGKIKALGKDLETVKRCRRHN